VILEINCKHTFLKSLNRDLTLGLYSEKDYLSIISSKVSFESSECPFSNDDETCLCIWGFGYNIEENLCGTWKTGILTLLELAGFCDFRKKSAVFGCLTNALAPPPIALESCSTAQTDRPV